MICLNQKKDLGGINVHNFHKRYIRKKKKRERRQKTGHIKLQGHLYINTSRDIKKTENTKRKINNKKEGEIE
jgi:hypothetical protein